MGYRVAPDSDEIYSELKIRSCPVALANRCSTIVDAYYRHKQGLFDLSLTYPQPSVAILQAFDILDTNMKILENRLQKQRMEDIKNGN
jgi:hypothetical protein